MPTTNQLEPEAPNSSRHSRHPVVVLSVIICVVAAYGLQQYVTVPAFPQIEEEFGLGIAKTSMLVSGFFLGYAIMHIPSGIAASRWGYKRVAVGGMVILTASTALFAASPSFTVLLVSRVIGGASMAAVVGCVLPLAAMWARPDRAKLIVGGVVNGLGFTIGAAAAFYVWTKINQALGWRTGMLLAASVGLVATILAFAFLATPKSVDKNSVETFTMKSAVVCLRSRSMWAIGLGSVAVYGGGAVVAQLAPGYVVSDLSFSESTAALLATLMLAVGAPSAILGGYLADRAKRFLPTLWIPALVLAATVAVFPLVDSTTVWLVVLGSGAVAAMYFSPCVVAPTEYTEEISPRDFGTALGLVLTLGNVGGILFPILYGTLAEGVGFTTAWVALGGLCALLCLFFLLAAEPRTARASSYATMRAVSQQPEPLV